MQSNYDDEKYHRKIMMKIIMENAQLKMKAELLARRAAQKIPMEKKSECARGVGW